MDEGGYVDEASLSEEVPWRGASGWGGAPSLGTLEDISLRIWASLSMVAPFHPRGAWYVGGGPLYRGL